MRYAASCRPYLGRVLAIILALSLIVGGTPYVSAAEKLTNEQVAALLPQLFKLHLKQRQMDAPFMKQMLKEFVNHLDGGKNFYLKDEAEAIWNQKDEDLVKLAERAQGGDFSYFTKLIQDFIDKQIKRDGALFDGLEARVEDIKAQLKPKAKVADGAEKPAPKTGEAGKDLASANSQPAAADAEDEDEIKWNERPLTLADRETRLLKSAALFYRANKTYLSDSEAIKLALLTVRLQRNKWLEAKVDSETPKLFLKSFMAAMDPHTVYFDAEEDEEFASRLERNFAGIGVQIRPCPLGAQVEDIIKGGPTEKSGKFSRGDQIVSVDGFVLAGLPINKIVRRIKGEKGTEVKLTLLKRETKQTEVVTLKRDTISVADMKVKGKKFETPQGTIGMVTVQSFYRDVHSDVHERIKELQADKPLAGLILDLRDNQGGYLEEAVALAGLFITTGPVVGERDGRNVISWKNDEDASIDYTGPLVVLSSQFSASASEIVAGTLKDYNRAVVVAPSQTFGKGTVQRVIPLSTLRLPGEIKITTHQYFLADGASVQLKGVMPDVTIPGPKLIEDMLERASDNAVPWNKIPGALKHDNADVKMWTEWKEKNLAAVQSKSDERTKNNQDYKDFFDPKKRKAKLELERAAAEKERKPDEPPPVVEAKKDEKDFHAEEAVSILQDMIPTWPKYDTHQAAK